jgi:nitrogen regulatory protein PII
LIKDRWYQFFLPTLSPEQELIHFLVPESETDHLMEQIAMVGKLRLYGAGSIFACDVESLTATDDFPLWREGKYTYESKSFDIRFKSDLTAIIHIAQKGETDAITRAAIKAGAQGPTVSYIQGYGLRDRLGLLRITKQHEKELITAVVDSYDASAVFDAMAKAGRVNQPGRGFIYQVPIHKGLTNLASVFNPEKHSASIQQVIRAIDNMQGNTNWRANQLLIHDPSAEEFKQDLSGTIQDSVILNLICHRKDTEILVHEALEAGVPGASIHYWRLIESDAAQTSGGQRINREFGCIFFVLKKDTIHGVQEMLKEVISENDMKETCFFSIKAPVSKTFLGRK